MRMKSIRYLLCMILLALLCFLLSGAAKADGLEVHFLDIGRNDGILIRCDGEDVFIDSGGYYRGELATKYMQSVGVTHLKYYIGTHAHDDHIGGAPVIIEAFRPDAVLQPHKRVKDAIIRNIQDADQRDVVRNANYVIMTVGQQVQVGGATLTCLGPVSIKNVSVSSGTENENSLVLMLTYGETDILLTGDATGGTLKAMDARSPGCLKADVLKNPHHYQYLSESVFSMIDPEYVIFSTANNKLPENTYLRMLNDHQSKAMITTDNHAGNIILRTDGQNISFETQYRTEALTLDKPTLTLYEGGTEKIKPTLLPSPRVKVLLYESSNPAVATVDYEGRVKAVSIGEAVIRVSDALGGYAECHVTVAPPQLKLKKTSLTVKDGSKVTIGWSVEPSRSKEKPVWASLTPNLATIDQNGKVTGIYPGEAVITATMPSGVVSTVSVTVTPVEVSKVTVKPSSATMTLGNTKNISASISPSSATWKDVVWSSEDESIVTVDANGMLQAVGVGKTKVTATAVGGKKSSISVTVKPMYVQKIILPQSDAELILGVQGHESIQLRHQVEPMNATNQAVTWSSSNQKIVTVDENGVITALKTGSVTITCRASDGSGKYAKIKVNVEKPTERIELNKQTVEVYEGTSVTLKAEIKPSSKNKKLFYESSNPSVAVVSSSGKVTGVRSGTAIIRVQDATGVYAECAVTVRMTEMSLRQDEVTVKDGSSVSASYSMKPSSAKPTIQWTSANEQIATVNASGRITGVYPGETIVQAQMPSGQIEQIRVTVKPIAVTYVGISPSSVSLTLGDSRSVKASISPSNATWKTVTWSSADEEIAIVTQEGLIQAVGVGKTKITATAVGGEDRSITVTVKPIYVKTIALTLPNVPLVGGATGRNRVQLGHAISPSDATVQKVTWSSSNKKIATVDENGIVTGLKDGSVTITCKATDGSGKYAKIRVTFAKNELNQSTSKIDGELTARATRIRYLDSGKTLEVEMTYHNRTGKTQSVPYHGTLVLQLPNGTQIPLTQVNTRPVSLKNGRSDEFFYRISTSVNPRLIGLDLTQCDAFMVVPNAIP